MKNWGNRNGGKEDIRKVWKAEKWKWGGGWRKERKEGRRIEGKEERMEWAKKEMRKGGNEEMRRGGNEEWRKAGRRNEGKKGRRNEGQGKERKVREWNASVQRSRRLRFSDLTVPSAGGAVKPEELTLIASFAM